MRNTSLLGGQGKAHGLGGTGVDRRGGACGSAAVGLPTPRPVSWVLTTLRPQPQSPARVGHRGYRRSHTGDSFHVSADTSTEAITRC